MFETLAHYKILEFIGAGGMGDVYRARDTRLGRTVAIKVVAPEVRDDPRRRERFLREARAAAALSHPNIAALYEIGEDQGQLFLAFEFVPGETLERVIGGRALNPRRAIDFAVQIADALADAHADGVVHRDLRPANVIITPKDKAKILDVGLAAWTAGGAAREQAAHESPAIVTSADRLGTVAYMSPEQALGERVDHRTDIFSLGVVLFEMLTGRLPFTGATPDAVTLQIVQAPAPSVSAINRSVPKEADAIVARALGKSLDQRYESAATMAAELRSIAAILDVRSEISEAAGIATLAPRRRGIGKWLVALLVVAALAAGAWYERGGIVRVWRRTLGPPPPPVIAVVPLELVEPDPSKAYFADGLTGDLMSRLGQTPGLKVLGRSATRTLRGRAPADVGRDLGAGVVLTGSVRPPGDAMRLSLELVDPRDGTAIWSSQYTRDVKDIFAVQAQIAGDVASALRVTLQPTRAREVALARVVDQRAYDLYLRGRHAAAERRLPEAIALYEQAVAADPGLGEAFAGIAEAFYLDVVFSGAPADAAHRDRLAAAAKRAYEIDPDLPDANVAMGLASDALAETLKYLRHALEVDPSDANAYHVIGAAIDDFDPERAIVFFRRANALDRDLALVDIAETSWRLGRNDEAETAVRAASPPSSDSRRTAEARAMANLHNEREREAIATFRALPDLRSAPADWSALVAALRGAGRSDDALAEATALAAKYPQDCEARAMLAALKFDGRDVAAARKLVEGSIAAANVDAPSPSNIRCGLHGAAAMRDGAKAAALLDRVSASEPMLRAFAQKVAGRTGTMWIDARVYPWSLVVRDPAVADARTRLDAAYSRERDTARAALAGLP